jgi:hypothetical protein
MPPYNFPIEQLTHTATLKCAGGKQETPAQKAPEPQATRHPVDRIAHWPPEMLRIVNRNPNIRLLLLEALEKEDKEKARGPQP